MAYSMVTHHLDGRPTEVISLSNVDDGKAWARHLGDVRWAQPGDWFTRDWHIGIVMCECKIHPVTVTTIKRLEEPHGK